MPAYPRYVRHRNSVVAGVASGLATHLRIDVLYVRLAFVFLSAFSGIGLSLYAGLWVSSRQGEPAPPPQRRVLSRPMNYLLVAIAVLAALVAVFAVSDASLGIVAVLLVSGLGTYLVWRAFDEGTQRRTMSLVVGAVLVVAGPISGVALGRPQHFLELLLVVLVTLAVVSVFAVPAVLRVRDSLAEKAATEEREKIASRLHDSVLQTLALIQKRADQPEEVRRLARAQERELRQWLFEPKESPQLSVFAAVDKASAEVEELYGVKMSVVSVGKDQPLTPNYRALVMAAREAMVNAAKHAEVSTVDIYVEADEELEIFIRDRGVGFDMDAISEDRHGIRDSIQARVEKVGGSVEIHTAPGEGTEVILRSC